MRLAILEYPPPPVLHNLLTPPLAMGLISNMSDPAASAAARTWKSRGVEGVEPFCRDLIWQFGLVHPRQTNGAVAKHRLGWVACAVENVEAKDDRESMSSE
jgi:hypothetical protein